VLRPRTIITTHVGPDFDGIASIFAAQKLWADALPVYQGRMESSVREFLALHGDLFRWLALKEIALDDLQHLIACDVSSPRRLGELAVRLNDPKLRITVYDHHDPIEGAEGFPPHTELIHRPYGALTTGFVELLREAEIPIAPVEATLFALGIAADTGNLTYPGVMPQDFYAMGYLHECGAQPELVQRFLSAPLGIEQRQLLVQLEASVRRMQFGGLSIAFASAAPEAPVSEVAVLTKRLAQNLYDDALFTIVTMNEKTLIVGRARSTAIDCAEVLALFGGGGHAGAAAVTIAAEPVEQIETRLVERLRALIDRPICARDIMSTPVRSLVWTATVDEAHQLLVRSGHSGIAIVDEHARLAGILSRRDADKALAHQLGHAPVRAYMTKQVISVSEDTPLAELRSLIADHHVGRLPVLRGQELVGIVTRSDVIRSLHQEQRHREAPLLTQVGEPRLFEGLTRLSEPLRGVIEQAGLVGDELGVAVYLVGGIVRDFLLDRPSNDVDLVVEGDALQIARKLAHKLELPIDYHPRFGTAKLKIPSEWGGGEHVDFATARGEWYAHPGALPQVEPGGAFDDTLRRDFTINAMALRLNGPPGQRGMLSDPWHGRDDLKAGLIRVLHPLSFVDDPTRIFRAVRFAARFQFAIEPHTEESMRQAIVEGRLSTISPQRLRNEIELLCAEEHAERALLLARDLGIWTRMHPGWAPLGSAHLSEGALARHQATWRTLEPTINVSCTQLALLSLFTTLPAAPLAALIERLTFDRATSEILLASEQVGARYLAALTKLRATDAATPSEVHRVLGPVPAPTLVFFDLVWASAAPEREILRRELTFTRHVALEIAGEDLLAQGIPAGPGIGKALAQVLIAKQDGLVSGKQAELELALRSRDN
jgi:tRNA nucleotidyltransferase (CCA-adding enzyme)